MKQTKKLSVMVVVLALLWGGVVISCDNNGDSGSGNPYISDDTYAKGFYGTHYTMDKVRDVYRVPAIPTKSDKTLKVYKPSRPYKPDSRNKYTSAQLSNIKYIVLKQSSEEDLYDEYEVSNDGRETKIGTGGKIMAFGKEGFLYLCGGSTGTHYGTFFFTKYGYSEFSKNKRLTYTFDKLNLGHNDVTEIFGSVN